MMRRKAFLLAGAGVLVAPGSALARSRGDGYTTIPYRPLDAEPYFRPGRELERNRHHLDPKIRDVVMDVNRSGWVWTAESCQGHSGQAWSPAPMLRLVCRAADKNAVLGALMEDVTVGRQGQWVEPTRPYTYLDLRRNCTCPSGWFEVRVTADHPGGTRRMGIEFFERFAERVT